jgi:hypothetical protein
MRKLGVFFTCFDELEATRYSLSILKLVYPDIPVYLTCESDVDFKILESEFPNVLVNKVEDTLTGAFTITVNNFRLPEKQAIMKKAAEAVINRLTHAIEYFDSEYVIMLDPDAIVRGHLNIPDGVGLLGTRGLKNPSLLFQMNEVLKKHGGKEMTAWGATPAIFNTKKFLAAKVIMDSNATLMDELCKSFYAVFAHDILLPVLFSLIGEEETFNPDIVMINNNPNWHETNCPLVHQFRFFYPKRTTKYATANW